MPMNKHTRQLLFLMTLLAILVLPPSIARTQTEKPEVPQQQQPSDKVSQETTATDESVTPDAAKKPPASPTRVKPVKQFTPTDKIAADSAVSFPIDI
jgi:hypothetical protein